MNTLIHADIFFFVSTIIAIVLSIGLAIALFYVIKILRNVSEVSETAKRESQLIADDVADMRSRIRRSGFSLPLVYQFIRKILFRKRLDS